MCACVFSGVLQAARAQMFGAAAQLAAIRTEIDKHAAYAALASTTDADKLSKDATEFRAWIASYRFAVCVMKLLVRGDETTCFGLL